MSASVALFGTSADPPTLGHQALLEQLLLHYPLVVTWASDNPGKVHGAPLQLRARMLAALVAALDDPRLSQEQGLSSPWAITTIERAAARWPASQLVFVVGSDLLHQIPGWRQAPQLLQRCRLAVVPRLGWPLQAAALSEVERLGGAISVLDLPIPGTASSELRQGSDPGQMAPAAGPVVREHNLYGFESQS